MKTENIDSLENEQKQIEKKTLTNCQIYLFMLLLLITGSINTSANKLQQNTVALKIKYAGHQKFITFCMFNGELLCLLLYWIKEGRFANKKEEGKSEALITDSGNNETKKPKKPKIWYFLFPAIFDILGSTISSISLSFLPSSIYQMFRGAVIIFTCSSSIIFLKNKYYRHHFFGIFVVVIGLVIVGLNAVLYGKSNASENPGFGIFLCVLSQAFSSMLMVTEEKLLKGYETPPLKAVGLEGMWGVICYIFLLIIFYFISCDSWPDFLKKGVCINDNIDKDKYKFENAIFAIKQIWESGYLKAYLSLYVLSIAFFNFSGLTISKHVSSTARTIVDTLRTIVIWAFFLTFPYLPEETKETFSWLQLLGFLVLILGSLIYNEILVIPFFGCGNYTKEAIKKREEKQKERLEKAFEGDNEEENNNEDNEKKDEEKKDDEKKVDEKEDDEKKDDENKDDEKENEGN
jgi:drug/metabolite transporter (DMT)-like permease